MPRRWTLLTVALIALSATSRGAKAQDNRPAPPATMTKPPTVREEARPWHVRALVESRNMELDAVVAAFEREHFSAEYMKQTSHAERLELMKAIQRMAAAANEVRAQEDDAGVHLRLDNREVLFTIERQAPFGIESIRLTAGSAGPRPAQSAPLTWDGLAARVKEAEAAGFSGQILARRDGHEVLRASYGLADQNAKRATTLDQVYCIGSTPIDFTVAAARLLIERGALSLDDVIGKYIRGVPQDKATMTIGMILRLQSGLPNFLHAAQDADPDLTYIDRETALRRIMAMPLLFAPGAGQEHSHAAFGLLAAIIEIASGKPYPEFVRTEILTPLGMTRTGFYGETMGIPLDQFATGYGVESVGTPNIPPNWGPTSWLTMGSGGMFSTLDDLRRYYDGLASGALYADKQSKLRPGVSVGGSDRGFFFVRVDDAKGNQILMMSNTESLPVVKALVGDFVQLVQPPMPGGGRGRGPGD